MPSRLGDAALSPLNRLRMLVPFVVFACAAAKSEATTGEAAGVAPPADRAVPPTAADCSEVVALAVVAAPSPPVGALRNSWPSDSHELDHSRDCI